jgi:hypothetical protein
MTDEKTGGGVALKGSIRNKRAEVRNLYIHNSYLHNYMGIPSYRYTCLYLYAQTKRPGAVPGLTNVDFLK